jgi:hypothetical protein
VINVCGKDVRIGGRMIRIASLDGDMYTFPDDLDALLGALRKCGTRIDLFTFMQRIPETTPKYDFPMEWDNLAVLPVSTFENWWKNQINSFPRNRARQAEKKGVVLREVPYGDELLKGICEVYNEVPVRQGKRFPHYGMTLERAREYAGTFLDRSVYIGAFLGDSMIGFIKLVFDESRTHACLVHILSMVQHKDKAPTNALIAQAVRSCADHGIAYLVYERFSYGKKQGDSLSRFKEVNGFRRMDLPRYYIPLTSLGRVAFRLGLHRKFVDRLPESVAAKLRDFRNSWHQQVSERHGTLRG